MTRIPVNFGFYPADPTSKTKIQKDGRYAYEKEVGGKKGRYLAGISSGSKVDAHGDFLTREAIEDLHKQAQEKDIPLYANHDRVFTDDIGVLRVSEVLDNGDWYTEYQLHDGNPEAEKVWNQINGLAPYSRKREFGFSIEGFIPESAIRKTAMGREISKVEIDPGVTIVTKPAYTVSYVTAIAKSMSGMKKSLKDMLKLKEDSQETYERKWDIESSFQELCSLIVNSDKSPEEKTQSLNEAFDQYKTEIVPVLLSLPTTEQVESVAVAKSKRIALAKNAIEILGVIKTAKGEKMNEDMKSVLGEIIASLQMLLQSGENTEPAEAAMKSAIAKAQTVLKKAENDGNPKDVPDETKRQVQELTKTVTEIAKAVAVKKEEPKDESAEELQKALAAMKSSRKVRKAEQEAEKAAAEEEANKACDEMEKAESEEQIEAAKSRLKKAYVRLAKAEEGNASDNAEEIIEGVLPDGDASAEEIAKAIAAKQNGTAVAKMLAAQASEIAVLKKAMGEMVAGFSGPVRKGLSQNLGQEPMLDRLAKMLEQRTQPAQTGYLSQFENSPIQKSKNEIAAGFLQMRKSM